MNGVSYASFLAHGWRTASAFCEKLSNWVQRCGSKPGLVADQGAHDSLSTMRRAAGIVMNVHVRVGFDDLDGFTHHALKPSPHEQPTETSQLDHPELHAPGLADHILVPGWIPDELY